MPRPGPLTDTERARILDLHAQGMSRNDIARETGRGAATITGVVQTAGRSFDRTTTAAATKARQADLAERRASLRAKLLAKAELLLDQIDQPHLVFNFGGRDNTYEEHTLDRPPTGDIRNLMQSASYAITAELRLADADRSQGDEAAKSLIVGLATALGVTGPDTSHPDDDTA
ncbi:MAG: helix-turn-helix domain-containing protein [Aeromicrobium sp.]|uniref:helix-turn-helix domain-containing protein n=1 Tax=Aeromicrobium sp. TaxID=1871063 RepID=UPI0039E24FEE